MITMPQSHIRILSPLAELDYFDSQKVDLPRRVAPLEAWNRIMAERQPLMRAAFRLRDAISSRFGVKRIGGFSGKTVESVKAGDHLDFFLVEHADEDVLVLTERDRHLDVMTCISSDGAQVSITSSVRVHNRFGRAYMLPVGNAHRWIVRRMLGRLRESITQAT